MAEDDKQPPKPPKPMKKTSAVPLKKETVRVTLKATPDEGSPKKDETVPVPLTEGGAKKGGPKPTPPTAAKPPSATKPPAPAPTIPLKTAKPGGGGAPPKPAAPAPTVQLKTPGQTTAPKTTPLKTQPLSTPGGAGGTQELPKATVQLGSATQALGAPTALSQTQAATIQTAVEEEDDSTDTVANILSIVAFVGALAVLGIQVMAANQWLNPEKPVEGPGWEGLIE